MKKTLGLLSIIGMSLLFVSATTAQEVASDSGIIANVNLVNQGIIAQNGRVFKVGINIQNKIGTQAGIMYGVRVVKNVDGKEVVVDQFATGDSLTLKQNEYAYKEFDYVMPLSITGEVTIFAFISTDKGITLGTAPLSKEPVQLNQEEVGVKIKNCTTDSKAKTLSCNIVNVGKKALDINLTTTIRESGSVFAPASSVLPIQLVSLKTKEEKVVIQNIEKKFFDRDITFETIIANKDNTSLIERSIVTELNNRQTRSIDNVLIEQTSAKDYVVKIISRGQAEAKAKVMISSAKKVCDSQEVLVSTTITPVTFALKKTCETALVTVNFVDANGAVMDSYEVKHRTLFPADKPKVQPLWILGGLALIAVLAVVLRWRKKA